MPFVAQRLVELSADLRGEVDGHDSVPSGDHGLQKGKLLPKPKARMDTYRIGRNVFSFVASSGEGAILQYMECLCYNSVMF